VIPVNIRVTDANDNAPQFINAPYILNISEVSMTNAVSGACLHTVQYNTNPGERAYGL
jgi:hypothetical protein